MHAGHAVTTAAAPVSKQLSACFLRRLPGISLFVRLKSPPEPQQPFSFFSMIFAPIFFSIFLGSSFMPSPYARWHGSWYVTVAYFCEKSDGWAKSNLSSRKLDTSIALLIPLLIIFGYWFFITETQVGQRLRTASAFNFPNIRIFLFASSRASSSSPRALSGIPQHTSPPGTITS